MHIWGTTLFFQRPRAGGVAFLLAAAFLLFVGLGAREFWGSEDRWAEVSREMLLSGDWFTPTLNGVPYPDKPLLSYWPIAALGRLTGGLSEWTVRLPSAAATLLALFLAVRLGRRVLGPAAARLAGWLLLTTYGVLFWGRIASADTLNLAAILLALLVYFRWRDRPRFVGWLAFWATCAVGAHAKGLTAVAVPVLAILPDVCRAGRLRAHLRPGHALAVAIGAAIWLAPFFAGASGGVEGGEFAAALRHNFERFFAPFDHAEPPWVYFYYLPELLLPWAPLVLAAIAFEIGRWRQLPEPRRWLLQALGLVFLFFTISGSRRAYYILPALPLACLSTAAALAEASFARIGRLLLRITKAALFLVAAAFVAHPLVWPFLPGGLVGDHRMIEWPLELLVTAPFVGAAALIFGVVPVLRSPLERTVAMAAVLLGGFVCAVNPALRSFDRVRAFALDLGDLARGLPGGRVAFYRQLSSEVQFYLDRREPLRFLPDHQSLRDYLAEPGDKVIVIENRDRPEVVPLLPAVEMPTPDVAERVEPWEGKRARLRRSAWRLGTD